MRRLLDECIDRRLARLIKGHTVKTVPQMGWAGLTNGRLLTAAAGEFDVFITVDRNLSIQQPVTRFDLAVIVIRARSNRVADLARHVPALLRVLSECQSGKVFIID